MTIRFMNQICHCFVFFLLLLFVTSTHCITTDADLTELTIQDRYQLWQTKYRRGYNDPLEQSRRFSVFATNVEFIDSFNNAHDGSFRLSVNEFADLTNEEFVKQRNGLKPAFSPDQTPVTTPKSFMYENVTNLPASIDWRDKGAMTPVEDQGDCGCCWAFSAVATVEGITQIKTGKLMGLSVQETVDCDKSTINQGCNGGVMNMAFEYILQNGGLTTKTNYPYKGAAGACNLTQAAKHAAQIQGFQQVPPDEDELMKAVANQPVSAAIAGGGSAIQFYSSGVFDGLCGAALTHGVTVVGYGVSKEGKKYWVVKNSWGKGWGEEGYMRLKRGGDDKGGHCGIAKGALYPIA